MVISVMSVKYEVVRSSLIMRLFGIEVFIKFTAVFIMIGVVQRSKHSASCRSRV